MSPALSAVSFAPDHFGTEQAIILTVQDFPVMAAQRNLIFEEPRGAQNIKLVSKSFVPHRDTAESFKLDI